MTPNEYQKLAMVTERTPPFIAPVREEIDGGIFADQQALVKARLLHGSIGLCTEVGELQDALKKHLIYGKPLDLVNVGEELGDILWYLALVADAAGTTLEAAMERNIAKLKARYPDGFSQHAALNRDLETERSVLENKG